MALMALYYVFNIQYCPASMFFQAELLGYESETFIQKNMPLRLFCNQLKAAFQEGALGAEAETWNMCIQYVVYYVCTLCLCGTILYTCPICSAALIFYPINVNSI